jgi:hypothetical protein
MSMILLEPAYKILHSTVKFKRRTISVTPYFGKFVPQCSLRTCRWRLMSAYDPRGGELIGKRWPKTYRYRYE